MSPVWTMRSAGVASMRSRIAICFAPAVPESPNTRNENGRVGSSVRNVDSFVSAAPLARGTYEYAVPVARPATGIAHTVPVGPVVTELTPFSGLTATEQEADTSVFQTTVTDLVLRSWRYGPRVSFTASAGSAAASSHHTGSSTSRMRICGSLTRQNPDLGGYATARDAWDAG